MSTAANPYASPQTTDLARNGNDAQVKPRIFALSGRIGRLRLLAYSLVSSLVFIFIGSILAAVLTPVSLSAGMFAYAVMVLLSGIYGCALYVRRLNDLGQSGLWVLLLFVPILNLGLVIYALFFPGNEGTNAYGPAPVPNGASAVLGLVLAIFVGIALMGMLAAIAIPAYQGYVERAQQSQVQ